MVLTQYQVGQRSRSYLVITSIRKCEVKVLMQRLNCFILLLSYILILWILFLLPENIFALKLWLQKKKTPCMSVYVKGIISFLSDLLLEDVFTGSCPECRFRTGSFRCWIYFTWPYWTRWIHAERPTKGKWGWYNFSYFMFYINVHIVNCKFFLVNFFQCFSVN